MKNYIQKVMNIVTDHMMLIIIILLIISLAMLMLSKNSGAKTVEYTENIGVPVKVQYVDSDTVIETEKGTWVLKGNHSVRHQKSLFLETRSNGTKRICLDGGCPIVK